MTSLRLTPKGLFVGDVAIAFPGPLDGLVKVLGKPSRTALGCVPGEHNDVYTWDEIGLLAYCPHPTRTVNALDANFLPASHPDSPKSTFADSFTWDNETFAFPKDEAKACAYLKKQGKISKASGYVKAQIGGLEVFVSLEKGKKRMESIGISPCRSKGAS